jgi:hypothetical protein
MAEGQIFDASFVALTRFDFWRRKTAAQGRQKSHGKSRGLEKRFI